MVPARADAAAFGQGHDKQVYSMPTERRHTSWVDGFIPGDDSADVVEEAAEVAVQGHPGDDSDCRGPRVRMELWGKTDRSEASVCIIRG